MKRTFQLSGMRYFMLCVIATLAAFIGLSLASCTSPTNGEEHATALTGTVAVDNTTPKVGDTLTAAYSGGNGTGTATWQWLRNDNAIAGTNSSTYTVVTADLGATIKARVSYAGQSGSVTSAATAAVTASAIPTLTGTVTINNTSPKVGDTLTANYSGGNGTGAAAWQWLRNDTVISGTNHDNYTAVAADLGATIKARVSYAGQSGSITSAATAAVTASALPALTGTVTINNTSPKVGDTLTAAYSGGNGTGTATWQWLINDNAIAGANSSTYTVIAADLGATIKARVSYAGQSGSVTSAATAAVTASATPTLTGTVTINNTSPKVGDTLTAAYSGGNGTGAAAWQWLRNDNAIAGASSSTYTAVAADLGATIKARVSYAGQSGSVTSAATAAVAPATLPVLTGTVTINNTSPKVGDTLTAAFSGGNGTEAAAWQWLRNDNAIAGANSSTYTVVAADLGATIKARVSYAGQSGSVTSAATAAIAPATLPILTGTVTINNTSPKTGDTLTAAFSGGNGTGAAAWQWLRNDNIIAGANSSTYTVVVADLGATIKARVSYAGQSGSVTSAATAEVVQTGTVSLNTMYYWGVNEQDALEVTGGGLATVSPGQGLTITAQGEGYTVIRWDLNGVDTGQTGASYYFSSWVKATHNVVLLVEKGGRYYSAEFSITVE